MNDMFLERRFDPPVSPQHVVQQAKESGWCFETYKVEWNGSMLSVDGRNMLCWFTAADAESIRQALTRAGADTQRLWSGTVHEAPEPSDPNVIVERRFDAPVAIEALQAIEDEHRWCLDTYNVKFARTFFSTDRRSMLCLYSGPDAEAVRAAQREAGMPVERVWAYRRIGVEDLSP
jgi:hypothetical protein